MLNVKKDLESAAVEVSNSVPGYVFVKVLLTSGKVSLYVICIEVQIVHEQMMKCCVASLKSCTAIKMRYNYCG